MTEATEDAIWSAAKYIGIGISSLFGTFLLWFTGRFWGEHAAMFKQFIENNSPAAKELREKKDADILKALADLNHAVNQLRQERKNLEPVFEQLDDISKAIKHGDS